MKDHIVLCGLGKVGFSILETLHSQNETVVVITKEVNPDWARRAERLAARLILADAREEEVLIAADVAQARALILATNDDLINLTLALEARKLCPQTAVVLRLFDPHLAERARQDLKVRAVLNAAVLSAPAFVAGALGEEVRGAFQIESAPLNLVTLKVTEEANLVGETLHKLAARFHVNPLAVYTGDGNHTLSPSLDHTLALGEEVLVATSHGVEDTQRAASGRSHRRASGRKRHRSPGTKQAGPGRLLRHLRILLRVSPQIQAIRLGMLTLVILGMLVFHFAPLRLGLLDAFYFTITIMSTVGFGDIHLFSQPAWVKLFGCLLMTSGPALVMVYFSLLTDYLVSRRFEETLRKPHKRFSDHIVVIGLGDVGYHVVMQLHEMGESVVVIERDRENSLVALLPDEIPIIFGDTHQPQRMQEAGFARARTVMALTGDDLVNLRIVQRAKSLNPRVRTIVRLFDSSLANRLEASFFGVDLALNPSRAAAATFAAATLAPDVLHGLMLDGRLLMLRRVETGQREEWVDRTIGELREDLGLLALLRHPAAGDNLHTVKLRDTVQDGDSLIVLEEYPPIHSIRVESGRSTLRSLDHAHSLVYS